MALNLPASVGKLTVQCNILEILSDSTDVDATPDVRVLDGTVEIKPSITTPVIAINETPKVAMLVATITCGFDANGDIRPPTNGESGTIDPSGAVILLAPDDSVNLSQYGWVYTATFKPSATAKWKPFSVTFTGGNGDTVNLAQAYIDQVASQPPINNPNLWQPRDDDLTAIAALSGAGYPLRAGTGTWTLDSGTGGGGGGSGTVTSVGMSVPTGFTVTGSPVTASGTIAVAYDTGYQGFTTTESSKLAGISAGAQVNVKSDWNASTGDQQILNKPTIPAAQVNSDWVAAVGVTQILNKPTLGTASAQDASYFATAAQGIKADLALQSVVAGANVTVDNTDPRNPVIASTASGGGGGTVTTVSVATANGFSGTVASPTTTPAITIVAGDITPTSVAASGTVTGSNLSGSNTGDQTSVTGNAGTATKLATARTVSGVSFDGTANITIPYSGLSGTPTLGTAAAKDVPLSGNASPTQVVLGSDTRLAGDSGTVTSVALTLPAWLSVSGSPVTTAGTLAVTAAGAQTANQFLATPNGAAGAVGLRALVAADVPTLNQSTTGNAATATALATARTINGVSFNGTANITVTAAATTLTGTSLNSTVVGSSLTAVGTLTTGAWNASPIAVAYGGTGANGLTGLVKANGTAAMTAATAGTDYVIPSGSITGNAATATALATARTIAGVSFDGTANIAIPFSGIASTPTTLAGYGITDAATKNIGAVAITGTAHTIAASDAGKDIQCNNAAAVTISIDKQATVPLDDGFTCLFSQVGAGAVTAAIVAASGVTLLVPNGAATTGVGDVRGLQHVSGDTWRVI